MLGKRNLTLIVLIICVGGKICLVSSFWRQINVCFTRTNKMFAKSAQIPHSICYFTCIGTLSTYVNIYAGIFIASYVPTVKLRNAFIRNPFPAAYRSSSILLFLKQIFQENALRKHINPFPRIL